MKISVSDVFVMENISLTMFVMENISLKKLPTPPPHLAFFVFVFCKGTPPSNGVLLGSSGELVCMSSCPS